ncbi:MAG: DHHA1 domain-containing protein [Candidatus Thermoplasmatota archaeon]|nr:DHHA1 domain-containing protein [Candidatus Thermoplasmatota archaeon]
MNVVPRRPQSGPKGWTFGRHHLPLPLSESGLWSVINRIIDSRDGGVLVLAHHNADIDAVSTGIILKRTFPWVDLGAYKSISHAGRSLLKDVDLWMEIDPDVSKYSLVVVIDASSPLQVSDGDLSAWPECHVIDHHSDNDHWGVPVYLDSGMGACVEIALQIAFLTGAPLGRDMAVSAIAGIVADTGKFRFASELDMSICGMVLEGSGIKMETVLGVIEGDEYFDVSKKIAMLKAMRRVRYEKVGDQVVATSMVSSFEASAARSMLVAGADVVFVASDKRGDLRVSTRAKPHILAMGIHLGRFMEGIGSETGNQGGGHDGAAGLNGKGNAGDVLHLCMDRMGRLLADRMDIKWKAQGRRNGPGRR